MSDDAASNPGEQTAQPTAPENIRVTIAAFETEERATAFGHLVAAFVRELSRHIDLSALDGVTIAADYDQALLTLDRGYETSHRLTRTSDVAIGVAMTPSVMREGMRKSHMVFNAGVLVPLEDSDHDAFGLAVHTLAHECAHVEISAAFDRCFPDTLLKKSYDNLHEAARWDIILACWDEYAATRIAAPFGEDPTEGYEQTFLSVLADARDRANGLIREYRRHGDVARIYREVAGVYGNLLKFACYHLGNLAGFGLQPSDRPETVKALDGHWFAPYFQRLTDICRDIYETFGRWDDQSLFERIGDLADELIELGGVHVEDRPGGEIYVDIPFTAQTMPSLHST